MKESSKNTASKVILPEANYSEMTDEQIDDIIRPFCQTLRQSVKEKGLRTPGWTEGILNVRRLAVIRLIHQGKSNAVMTHELHDRWGVTNGTASTYINDALKYLSEIDTEPRLKKKKIEEMLEKTMEKCEAEGNHKLAMQALDMLNKMGGNYVTKVEAEIKTEIEFNFGGESTTSTTSTDEED